MSKENKKQKKKPYKEFKALGVLAMDGEKGLKIRHTIADKIKQFSNNPAKQFKALKAYTKGNELYTHRDIMMEHEGIDAFVDLFVSVVSDCALEDPETAYKFAQKAIRGDEDFDPGAQNPKLTALLTSVRHNYKNNLRDKKGRAPLDLEDEFDEQEHSEYLGNLIERLDYQSLDNWGKAKKLAKDRLKKWWKGE